MVHVTVNIRQHIQRSASSLDKKKKHHGSSVLTKQMIEENNITFCMKYIIMENTTMFLYSSNIL